jgi:nitronate monooxygenase
VAALHDVGTRVIGTATCTAEATALEAAGCDAIVAQGIEAGGHRGTFLHAVGDVHVGLVALVQQATRAVRIPVIAAGGLASGEAVAAMMMMGAAGGAVGSLFLRSPESSAAPAWKAALANAPDTATGLTQAFSGRTARGIVNRVMRELAGADIPPYPQQNTLTRDIRDAAARMQNADFLSLWCGQAAGLATEESTAIIMKRLIDEWRRAQR